MSWPVSLTELDMRFIQRLPSTWALVHPPHGLKTLSLWTGFVSEADFYSAMWNSRLNNVIWLGTLGLSCWLHSTKQPIDMAPARRFFGKHVHVIELHRPAWQANAVFGAEIPLPPPFDRADSMADLKNLRSFALPRVPHTLLLPAPPPVPAPDPAAAFLNLLAMARARGFLQNGAPAVSTAPAATSLASAPTAAHAVSSRHATSAASATKITNSPSPSSVSTSSPVPARVADHHDNHDRSPDLKLAYVGEHSSGRSVERKRTDPSPAAAAPSSSTPSSSTSTTAPALKPSMVPASGRVKLTRPSVPTFNAFAALASESTEDDSGYDSDTEMTAEETQLTQPAEGKTLTAATASSGPSPASAALAEAASAAVTFGDYV